MSDLNDPRVLFAAERTLLAWTRTSLTLMALGFAVERLGLFLAVMRPEAPPDRTGGFAIGLLLIALGAVTSAVSVVQFRRVVATLKPVEIPAGYWLSLGAWLNVILAGLGGLLVGLLAFEAL